MPTFRTPAPRRFPVGLTALVDVVFILLVFFMLASSFLEWRAVELKLPAEAAVGAPDEPVLVVSIADDGALRLDGERIAVAELGVHLHRRLADDPARSVLVRAAGRVPLQRTIAVLEAVSDAGGRNVSLSRGGRAAP